MPAHNDDRLDAAESPELTGPAGAVREITTFAEETVDEAGADGVVVCQSGGIDSTVSATLAVEALGRYDVCGLLLPADPTRVGIVEDALTIARDLGIEHGLVDVQPVLDEIDEVVTGERTERRPDPIGDSYETEVRQLARYLGVPDELVEKPPTAGLWADQTDESELCAPYETIDAALRSLADDRRSVDETASSLDLDPSFVALYADMVERSEHERIPPLTPTDRAFLFDWGGR